MFGFFGALLGAHGKKAVREVTDAVVRMDPTTATAAQLEVMEKDLDKVGTELAKFRADATRERKEAEDAKVRFDRMSGAAFELHRRYEGEADLNTKAELEKSLTGLITSLEAMKGEMAREESEAVEAEQLVREIEQIYTEKAEALRTAKTQLQQAARELERAKIAESHAEQRAEAAARVAGLRDNETGGLNAALTAMQRQTAEARATAEAKRLKADVLSKADVGSLEDPHVKAALASVQSPSSSLPFAERLAALSAKPAAPVALENKSSS